MPEALNPCPTLLLPNAAAIAYSPSRGWQLGLALETDGLDLGFKLAYQLDPSPDHNPYHVDAAQVVVRAPDLQGSGGDIVTELVSAGGEEVCRSTCVHADRGRADTSRPAPEALSCQPALVVLAGRSALLSC